MLILRDLIQSHKTADAICNRALFSDIYGDCV